MRDRMLERSQLFVGLSAEDAQTLAREFVFVELEPATTVVKQGERAPGMFFLLCGAAEAVRDGVTLGTLGAIRGEWAHVAFNTRTAAALIYLATIGAVGGFVAYTYALRHLPVSFVSLYAYINPIIAVALGVSLLGEPFTLRIALAAALVLAGVGIVRAKTGAAKSSA